MRRIIKRLGSGRFSRRICAGQACFRKSLLYGTKDLRSYPKMTWVHRIDVTVTFRGNLLRDSFYLSVFVHPSHPAQPSRGAKRGLVSATHATSEDDLRLRLPSLPIATGDSQQKHHTGLDWVIETPVVQIRPNHVSYDTISAKLSILMSAYNEQDTIERAVGEILTADYPCDIELIVVDDGSTDRTPLLLAAVNDPRVIVHRHPSNLGKGAGLLSAASLATGTHILPFDADLEYLAADISRMLDPVLTGRCTVVYGTRLFGCNTVYRSYRYAAGNRLLTRLANVLFDSCLSDLHTCLKLMPLAMLRSANLSESGFGLDTELTAVLLKGGIRPFEVPGSYFGRSHAQGKKITWRDAVVCVWILVRVRLRTKSRLESVSEAPNIREEHRIFLSHSEHEGHFRALHLNDEAPSSQLLPPPQIDLI